MKPSPTGVTLALALTACSAARPQAPALATAPAAPALPALRFPPSPMGRACTAATLLENGVTTRGTTRGRDDTFHAPCAYGASSPDQVFRMHLDAPSHVAVRVTGAYDTVVHVRSACDDDDSVMACNDDQGDRESRSSVELDLSPGDYFVVVDGYASGHSGFFTVTYRARTVPPAALRPLRAHPRVAPGEGITVSPGTPAPGAIEGAVTFSRRTFTSAGLTPEPSSRPAPRFVVEALDSDNHLVADTDTDDAGRFSLHVPPEREVRVRVVTRTRYLGNDLRVVSDPGTERLFEVSTRPQRWAGEHVAFNAFLGGVEPAGAFNILAEFVRYIPYIQRGFNRPLAPLFAFWERGNNEHLPQGNITAFLRDYARRPGTYALQIQGGVEGHEDRSDSDQFDDPVVLHEFSHFVIHTLAGNFSPGGLHPGGSAYFPGLALDEGAASALGCAVTGDPHYWDTSGLAPTGEILVEEDSEGMTPNPPGLGSQDSAQMILWDLMDGAEDIPDRDHDGIAIGLSGALRIYASFHDDPVGFASINSILERGVSLGLFTEAQASRLVQHPTNHHFTFPLVGDQRFPIDVPMGTEVHGHVDGMTQPAPSGGRNRPDHGYDAWRTYRFVVARRAMIAVELNIEGDGRQASGTDLDLTVTTRQLEPLATSATYAPLEQVRRVLDPGTYLVLVRDGDLTANLQHVGTNGNRANFRLRVREALTP